MLPKAGRILWSWPSRPDRRFSPSSDEDLEDARWLRTYLGKAGFVQLGFAFQGVMMVYEVSTEWYDHYQRLMEVSEDFGGIAIDGSGGGADDEP